MNQAERLKALLGGKKPDKVPAGFWFHYKGDYTVEQMVEAHLELYRTTGADVIKLMQDYMYEVDFKVEKPADWYKLVMPETCPAYEKLLQVIRGVRAAVKDEVMLFQTMFGPFKTASQLFGDELVMRHAKEDPDAVAAGVKTIAEALTKWAKGFLDAGADGIYYSAQFGEKGRFTKAEWEKLVSPSDLMVLEAVESRSDCYSILHICGEPEYDFKVNLDWFADYPGDLVNWSVKDNGFSLQQGKELFRRPILGGLNNKGNILNGSDEEIRAEVEQVISEFGTEGLMVGADCTIQGKNISLERIRTAVETAHSHTL